MINLRGNSHFNASRCSGCFQGLLQHLRSWCLTCEHLTCIQVPSPSWTPLFTHTSKLDHANSQALKLNHLHQKNCSSNSSTFWGWASGELPRVSTRPVFTGQENSIAWAGSGPWDPFPNQTWPNSKFGQLAASMAVQSRNISVQALRKVAL